ncbi:MAG TPA: DNA polymerase III subunit alpha [Rhodanobacteraceae bacterium]|nr:DNA polymerase III subunit alpha [Rhodanobacteraceae bacterium]
MPAEFIHLHVHSEYSLIDSTIRVGDLVDACVAAGMPAVALTDQSNLFALVKFYKAAEAAGIKPIAGCDLWVADRDERAEPHRLMLLCQNREGYLNLSRLLSRAYAEGRHGDRAIVRSDWLDAAGAGLIALAGRDSEIGRLVIGGREDYARVRAERLRAQFPDRFYLEATRTHWPNEDVFLDGALALAETLDLPIVATNDVRFLARDDFEAHEARVCIHAGRVLADPKRPREYSAEQYLKTPEAMAALWSDLPELVENSVELAMRCNLELSFGKYFLPAFPVPSEHTLDSFIRSNARDGLVERLAKHPPAAGFTREHYEQRLELELDVIVQMGFPGYFLIVADFINWAKQHDIPVGPGRGSGAGSLVAYALGITDLDPLRYDLLFERFLNPERVSLPDFDVDFCMDRRDEVIDYVAGKYGRDRVSQIITYGTMAAKAVLRDTGRVLGMPYGQVDRIAKLLPKIPLDLSLEDALGRSEKSHKEPDRVVGEFKQLYASDEEVKELVDLALKLEDLTRNAGKHAGGVVIAPGPLSDYAPLFSEGGGDGLVTQFDKDDVEAVGLVKFDFLGLRTLTIIDWAVKAINAKRVVRGEAPVDIAALPMDDAPSYALLKRCQTTAIFQLESRGMRDLVKKLQPDNFEDIIALVALFRPGPLQSGMVDDFIARKHGRAEVSYPHAKLEPILKPTYGVIVYQEQVMQIAQVLAGYSLGGADLLRRAMGKKKPEEMAKQRVTFEEGAAANGIDAHLASAIFDLMEKFAEYGFNKSHSAAYALVAYQTAWLKAHYPAEFMAAVLSADMDNTDKVVNFLAEARAMSLVVQPPDINASNYMFEARDERTIMYGLGAVKGVGRGAVESIVAARTLGGAFRDIADFCRRVDAQKLNKRVLEALILSGSMDALAPNRASLMLQLPEAMRAAEQRARDAEAGQNDMFGAVAASAIESSPLPTTSEWPIERKLAGERETLGHYLSGHPTDSWRGLIARVATSPIGEIEQHYKPPAPHERRGRFSDQSYTIAGQVIAIRKRGDAMAFVQVEDFSGRIEVSLFREAWVEYGPLLTRDAILVFDGGLSLDDFSGNYQLRVNSVATIESACERAARVLRVKLNGVHGDFIARLQHALAAHRGGATPVRLTYHNAAGQAEIELGNEWRVRASPALKDSLQALDGVVAAELVFG